MMRQAALSHFAVVWAAVACGACAAAQPALDRTDPAAVAQAYVQACRVGDVTALLSLVSPDDPIRPAIAEAVTDQDRGMQEVGLTMQDVLLEFLFLPLKFDLDAEPAGSDVQGDTATVRINRNLLVEQRIVLQKAPDGTWFVKPIASVKATTGRKPTFLELQQSERSTGRQSAAEGPAIWISQERLRRLQQALEEYAREHDNRYPPARTWTDAIEPYVLEGQAFKCPAAPELECGYAMNAAAGGQAIPQDWGARRALLLLFEWPGGERNASAMPDKLATIKSFRPDHTIAAIDATGNTRTLEEGVVWEDIAAAGELSNTCYSHLRILAQAARKYAREHDGLLPNAATWQDDLAVYLLDQPDPDAVYRCPAAPDLDCAYAINEEIAGKNARELTGHDSIVLFFESDLNVPNASGLPERDASAEGRHVDEWNGGRRNNVAYLSGTVGSQPPSTPNP
jgi:hypothetical protein